MDRIFAGKNIILFPHSQLDGDALGSVVALALALDGRAKICIADKVPRIVEFLLGLIDSKLIYDLRCVGGGAHIASPNGIGVDVTGAPPKVAVLVDCGDVLRIPEPARDIFAATETKIVIDHHRTTKPIYDMNIIEPEIPATCQIIYGLLKERDIKITLPIATALLTGMMTDTGRFSYANLRSSTLRIAAELMDLGANPNKIAMEIYQNIPLSRMRLESEMVKNLQTRAGGLLAIAYMTAAMLKKSGTTYEDGDAVVEIVRNIEGVEVSVVVKEKGDGKIKVSMRSKNDFNVAEISALFGGGGHKNAAGFDSEDGVAETIDKVTKVITERL
jgi:phosphoesterase RecJ-like protein